MLSFIYSTHIGGMPVIGTVGPQECSGEHADRTCLYEGTPDLWGNRQKTCKEAKYIQGCFRKFIQGQVFGVAVPMLPGTPACYTAVPAWLTACLCAVPCGELVGFLLSKGEI